MSRAILQTLGFLLGLSVVVRAQNPQAPEATFRARVDLIQVDVSVLDRDRHPVSGLTAADFILTEDGRPRPIVSFTAVHVPPPTTAAAGWVADIAPDVTTNTHPPGRLVVIAIDDAALSTNGASWGVQKARAAARAAVTELGPDDLAALVLTEHGRTAQNFTNDRARLLAAIDNTPLFPGTDNPDPRDQKQNWRSSCTCGLCTKPTTTVDVLARAFDTEARVWGTRRLSVRLGLNAANDGPVSYEILPRLAVPPGKYEIRVAVRTEDARSGSVYTFVDVPDFSRPGVWLSGIVLEAAPAVPAAPPDAYADLLPVVPTARRDFGASDRVSAFVRVYQGGSHALVPATLTTRIVDAKNEQMTKSTRELDPSLFAKGRAFDHRFDLPRNLAAGEYLFTVEIAAAGKTAERALRFRVR